MKRKKQTKQAKRAAQRQIKQAKRYEKRIKKLKTDLVPMLDEYLRSHYGNPATGRYAAVLDGPVIAKLSAASTLLSLLLTESKLSERKKQ